MKSYGEVHKEGLSSPNSKGSAAATNGQELTIGKGEDAAFVFEGG